MAKQRLGEIKGQYLVRAMIAERKAREALDATSKDEVRLMSPQGIRAIAKYIADEDRVPDSVMLDTILRDYWRMAKPDKHALLRTYRSRCGMDLPVHWKDHHCQIAAFLESLIPREGR